MNSAGILGLMVAGAVGIWLVKNIGSGFVAHYGYWYEVEYRGDDGVAVFDVLGVAINAVWQFERWDGSQWVYISAYDMLNKGDRCRLAITSYYEPEGIRIEGFRLIKRSEYGG